MPTLTRRPYIKMNHSSIMSQIMNPPRLDFSLHGQPLPLDTHSAYLRQRRSNPNSIFINVKNVIGAMVPVKIGVWRMWRSDARPGKGPSDPATTVSPSTVDCRTASCDCNTPVWWGTRDRRDFYFRSGYFRFRPGCTFQFLGWISALMTSERFWTV